MSTVIPTQYSGVHFSFDAQLVRLKKRGLGCSDEVKAVDFLKYISYYSFSDWYLSPFIQGFDSSGKPKYNPRYNFEDGVKLYLFDAELKILCLEVLKVFELKLRTQIAYVLGRYGKNGTGHLCSAQYLGVDSDDKDYKDWMSDYTRKITKGSKDDSLVSKWKEQWGDASDIPIWVAVESFDFGMTAKLYKMMAPKDKATVQKEFRGLATYNFEDVIERMQTLRNVSSHYAPLWSKGLHEPKPSDRLPFYLDPLCAFSQQEIDYLGWKKAMRNHLLSFAPIGRAVSLNRMGYTKGWENRGSWS